MSEPLTEIEDSAYGSGANAGVVSLESTAAGAAAVLEGRGADPGVVKRKLGFGFWLAMTWVGLMLFLAFFGSFLPLQDPTETNSADKYAGFSSEHWLGADQLGRDLLARVVDGASVSIIIGIGAISVGIVVGGLIGLVSGFHRGWTERTLMAANDLLLSVPALILLLSIVTFIGRDMENILLALAILSIAPIARLARANTLQWSQREFVQAARVLGAKNRSLMFREILPNVMMPMLYLSLIGVGIVIVAEGTLAYLGLGIVNEISWGSMVVEGKESLDNAPHVAFVPSAFIFLTVLSLNYAGERVRMLADARGSVL